MSAEFTPSWSDIIAHAKKRIEELRDTIESAPETSVSALQGEVRAWRQVLKMPEQMLIDAANALEASKPETSGY